MGVVRVPHPMERRWVLLGYLTLQKEMGVFRVPHLTIGDGCFQGTSTHGRRWVLSEYLTLQEMGVVRVPHPTHQHSAG